VKHIAWPLSMVVWMGLVAAAQALPPAAELEAGSPVLRRWLSGPPDLLNDIENSQAFPTRLGFGAALLASNGNELQVQVSLQDVVLGGTHLSLSSDYSRSNDSNQQWGASVRYYVAPLGSYFNFAPQVGYRGLLIDGTLRSGTEVGGKLLFALAPRAADISVSQSWVLSEVGDSIGRTVLEFGYSLSPLWRVTAVVELVNSSLRKDTGFGLRIELTSF